MKRNSNIKWVESDSREYAIFESMEHLMHSVDLNVPYNDKVTRGSHEDIDLFNGYISDSDSSWTYGSEEQSDYLERCKNRIPEPETFDLANQTIKKYLNSKEVMSLYKKMMSKRKRRYFTDDNGIINIPRILSGNPNYFLKRRNKEIVGIKVGMKGGLTCEYSSESFANLIASLIISIRMLEFIGIPIELYYIGDSQNMKYGHNPKAFSRQGLIFPIKRGGERVNLKKICVIGGSSFFRHHVFAAWTLHLSGRNTIGLGSMTSFEYDEDSKLLNLDIIIGEEYLDNNPVDIFNIITKNIFKK